MVYQNAPSPATAVSIRMTHMKPSLASYLVILLAALLPFSAGGADGPPKRSKKTCAQLRTAIEEASKGLKFVKPIKVTPGSWGDLPAQLRKLPPGAELCGAGSHGQVIVASATFGKEIESHYAPLFEAIGCKPLKCSISSTTNCTCASPEGGGAVLTDVAAETYTISFMKMKK